MAPPASPRPAHPPPSQAHPPTATAQAPGTSGSQTVTATASPEPELVLRLRGAHDASTRTSSRRRIQWAEGTVDNEGLGRKKSKVCCIYHKERAVGESSDESSSDSDASDSGVDDGAARPAGGTRKAHGHGHGHHGCEHGHGGGRRGKGRRKPSPNAYERMPKYDVKSLKQVDKTGV